MGNSNSTNTDEVVVDASQITNSQDENQTQVPIAVAVPILDPTSASSDKTSNSGGDGGGVLLSMNSEFNIYSTSDTEALVGVNFQAPAAPSDNDRAPVDCVVVSDVSGSMAGAKMTLLKDTVDLLLNEFVAKDRVGLVTFDSYVNVPFPLQSLDSRAKAKAVSAVKSFKPGSSTNLSGGCFSGIQQLLNASHDEKAHVKTVFLMTDGQANNGLQTAEEMLPVLTNMLKDSGISLHCFGYGADHDEKMLRAISTAGNGSYYFVEGTDDIRSAFGDCLGGMLSVVAQNLELELEAINGASISKVHHKSAVEMIAGKKYRVPFADLYGEEQRDVLVSMKIEKNGQVVKDEASPEGQVLRATLRYIDVIAAMPKTVSAVKGLARVVKVNPKEQVQNENIALQSTRLKVADTLERANASAKSGNLKQARDLVAETRVAVSNVKSLFGNNSAQAADVLTAYENDLEECTDGLADNSSYQNMSKKMAFWAEGHQQQRCMESKGVVDVSSGNMKLRSNAYRTKAKTSKASMFSGYSS